MQPIAIKFRVFNMVLKSIACILYITQVAINPSPSDPPNIKNGTEVEIEKTEIFW